MNAISVPIVSVPSSYSRAPSASTATVAITPKSSIAGKNSDDRFCACWLERWLARLSSENCPRKASSRLYDWITAMPASDSAMCAVRAEMRVRTSAKAVCERVWNQRDTTIVGGRITSVASASRQSSSAMAMMAPVSVSTLPTRVESPSESTSESASTSLVMREMIQPARCREK